MLKNTKLQALLLIVVLLLPIAVGYTVKKHAQPQKNPKNTQQHKVAQNKSKVNAKEVILATTTGIAASGLFDVLKPQFEKKTGYILTIVSVGSEQAIGLARKGEVDALLINSPQDEMKEANSKVVTDRRLVMHNDYILLGPANDPAKVKGKKITDAFKAIKASKSLFISQESNSEAFRKELSLWQKAGVKPDGSWYQKPRAGTGQFLNSAAGKTAYTLTDRATYLTQQKTSSLVIMLEKSKDLLNVYHVMQVNPDKFKRVNSTGAKAFGNFMVSNSTQQVIKDFGIDKFGQALFVPDAAAL